MELYGIIWNYLELYGIIWDNMELNGIIWNYMDVYGIIWNYMELYGIFMELYDHKSGLSYDMIFHDIGNIIVIHTGITIRAIHKDMG